MQIRYALMREDDHFNRGFPSPKGEKDLARAPCSLRTVIEDALRAAFAKERKRSRSAAPPRVKTFKGTGVQPGIDLSCPPSLLDAMEAMILLDINILVSAHREDADQHREIKAWMETALRSRRSRRIGTSLGRPRDHASEDFQKPTTSTKRSIFSRTFVLERRCTSSGPGAGHWEIFVELCRRSDARGNLVPDAFHAALAIELGCEWLTLDRGFARFPGLKWRHPLD